jgi:hypothetical protein
VRPDASNCFECAFASTNPLWLETDTPWKFTPKAWRHLIVTCRRFEPPSFVQGNSICGEFIHRSDFLGLPPLPPSADARDAWRDDPDDPRQTYRSL